MIPRPQDSGPCHGGGPCQPAFGYGKAKGSCGTGRACGAGISLLRLRLRLRLRLCGVSALAERETTKKWVVSHFLSHFYIFIIVFLKKINIPK
jgi:hypothetical protein